MARLGLVPIVLCLIGSVFSQAPHDPLKDFCRRYGHQTAVIDRKLYIDGGYVNANPLSQNPQAAINVGLLYQDLNITEGGMPELFANLSKNSSVPDVAGGILWADKVNKIFYLYGGQFSDVPEDFTLWGYDTILNQWNESAIPTTQVNRVSYGAGVAVSERAEGYYLGGYLNNKTNPAWTGPQIATSNLLVYDMIGNAWTNNTGPDAIGKAEGVMVYIPASGAGLLIYFGGVLAPYGNETVVPSPMDTIYLYDIAESKWYNQRATGTVPENRRLFCAGATWANDQSSYNIYLYGGKGFGVNATGFDDVYILTMPSFEWIKWYPTAPGPGAPHNTLTCNVIDGAQMLVIGGTFPATDQCDARDVWGTHNLNLGKNDPTNAMWALYQPNLTTYNVPPEIIKVVGGQAQGGATVKEPANGWDNRDLPVYFNEKATFTARTPTRAIPTPTSAPPPPPSPPPAKKSNTGAIAGGAVGGAVFLLAVIALLVFCLRRRRQQSPAEPHGIQSELPAGSTHSPSTYYVEPKHSHNASAIGSPHVSAHSPQTGSPYTTPPPVQAYYPPPQPHPAHVQTQTPPVLQQSQPMSTYPHLQPGSYNVPAYQSPQQQYFPPPADAVRPDPVSARSYEMPTVRSPGTFPEDQKIYHAQ